MKIKVSHAAWAKIRDGFTEDEKASLRSAAVSATSLPERIVTLELDYLPEELKAKLVKELTSLVTKREEEKHGERADEQTEK